MSEGDCKQQNNEFIFLLEGAFWYPTGILRRNRAINAIHSILAHYLPAYILDILARAAGKKPM